ncbi:hypothetical protein B0H12DRAFT_1067552 [Mycena haematopus]|nr:hypothetical protein B0H12DRAFT_1067552 [Mycena haematopus]
MPTIAPLAPVYTVLAGHIYLFEEIIKLVLRAFADDDEIGFFEFLYSRAALLRSNRWAAHFLRSYPPFWNRILVSPATSISTLENWFAYSDEQFLTIAFYARPQERILPPGLHSAPLAFIDYVAEATHIIGQYMDRCISLSITAHSPAVLDEILFSLEWTSPIFLQTLRVNFRVTSYRDLRPYSLQHFTFLDSSVAMDTPFPHFTILSWAFRETDALSVTYHTSDASDCSIVHPMYHPVLWMDVIAVIAGSPLVHTVILDGIALNYRLGFITCSPPLWSIRVVDLTFHGLESMAYLVSRLNLPCVETLRVKITNSLDVQCLCTCSNLLSSIKELVLVGACRAGNDFPSIFSLMYKVQKVDLRLVSNNFFNAFVIAANRSGPLLGPNWNACPSLKALLVHNVALSELRSLLLVRRSLGYPEMEHVTVCRPVGGQNVVVVSWFQLEGVELKIEE